MINKKGEFYTIINYIDSKTVDIQFSDNTIIRNVLIGNVRKGEVKNPNYKRVYGVGYLGQGGFKTSFKGKTLKVYTDWYNMLRRCYDEKTQEKYPTYKNIKVCTDWHNFQNFAEWYYNNYIECYFIDKDIICNDCKIYSPENCCFVPNEINMLFVKSNKTRGGLPIGVHKHKEIFIAQLNKNKKVIYLGRYKTETEAFEAYKTAKETYIKEVANKYKNKISKQVYTVLINYKVKITD